MIAAIDELAKTVAICSCNAPLSEVPGARYFLGVFGFLGGFGFFGGLGLGGLDGLTLIVVTLGLRVVILGLRVVTLGLSVVTLVFNVVILGFSVVTWGFSVVILPFIVDTFTVNVDAFTDETFTVLGLGDTLVMTDFIVLALPFSEVILTCVMTLETGACGYTSVTVDVIEVAFTVGEVGVITVVTVVVTGPPSILLVSEFQKPCCVLVMVNVEAGTVTVTGTVTVETPAEVLDGLPG